MAAVPPSAQFAVATLSIGGMTCSSCSAAIQDGLEKLPIVKSSTVSALTNSGRVVFDQTRSSSISDIVRLIEDKGYDCSVESIESAEMTQKSDGLARSDTRTVQLMVDGMFCNGCPLRIANSLAEQFGDSLRLEGSFGIKNPILSVVYHPESPRSTIRSIIAHIQSLNSSFSIQVYHPPTIEDKARVIQRKEQRAILWRLIAAGVAAIPTLIIGVVCTSLLSESSATRQWMEAPMWTGSTSRAQWALFFLATPVYFVSASSFHRKAAREVFSLWRRRSSTPVLQRFYRFGSMNLLISAGTTVAYFSSLALLIVSATNSSSSQNSTYFDSVVFLTFFILIGRYLEAISKTKAGDAVSMLGRLRPETALLVAAEDVPGNSTAAPSDKLSNDVREISADLLEVGDEVVIPQGSTPPADGRLVSGSTKFDESSLTGESRAVNKASGDMLFLGTINLGSSIRMKVTEIGGSSMLDQIVNVVREGQSKRAPIERTAATITAYFVPLITLLAILTFFIWFALGTSGVLDTKYLDGNDGGWAFWSLEFAIAVFVVACPCGIGLAAPTALFVGSGMAAKAGVLVRGGGEAFQDASHLDAIVFDKTGTLTEGGDFKVTDCEALKNDLDIPDAVHWNIARILEENSGHPIAKAIAATAVKRERISIEASEITEIPGQGMKGQFILQHQNNPRHFEAILGSELLINSTDPNLLKDNSFARQLLSTWKTASKSIAILTVRETQTTKWHIAILFALSDPIRPSAATTIVSLQTRGIKTYLLSGDNAETALAVALAVGIPAANGFANALPQDKAARITTLRTELTQHPTKQARIAFVGDGINDAPALLASTVSISLSSGSPIALTSSSFILLTPSLESIITLLDLSRKVFRRVRWNFAWALVYNLVLIPVAAGVLFWARPGGFILGPVWASAAMALSSVSVVLASLALRWGL